MRTRFRFFAAAVAAISACGGGAAQAPAADATDAHGAQDSSDDAKPPATRQGPSVSQELGEIDAKDTARAIDRIQPDILSCQKAGAARIDYLAGEARAFVRLDQDGHVRFSYLEGSTLGDRATEKCILGALAKAPWPKPRGGEAEVRKSFAFDGGDAREPTLWAPEKMFDAIAKSDSELTRCKGGVSGKFAITAYVVPDGKGGKVESVGIAPPNKDGEAKSDCIADVVRAMTPPSPGSYAAKVSFSL